MKVALRGRRTLARVIEDANDCAGVGRGRDGGACLRGGAHWTDNPVIVPISSAATRYTLRCSLPARGRAAIRKN